MYCCAEPLLRAICGFVGDGLNVYCQTSLDNDMVTLIFACSYDGLGGPPQPCIELCFIKVYTVAYHHSIVNH